MDKHSTLYKTLLIVTALVLTFTLVLYAVLSGRNPLNRIGFAVFISVCPAVLTLIVIKLMQLSEAWWRVVLVYLAVFIVMALAQSVVRSIG